MSGFGTVADYETGNAIRPATPAEWRKTAEAVSIHPATDVSYPWPGATQTRLDRKGRWQDADGRLVYVDGGPDPLVTEYTLRDLAREAAAAGDLAMVELCDRGRRDDAAFDECARVVLDNRMRGVTDADESAPGAP